jgi:Ni/Fe-hydrogenase subunit HybB-like protein
MREFVTSRTRIGKDILWFLALAGLVAAIFRLWFGLGATTNLSDAVPWGLWKILNMVGGVALSTSGFTVGFLVYVLQLKKFRPFMKPAILIAFLGYGCSCLALLFDIGLPHRFWHPIFMWNINSFLFEVFWCVLLYFTVTAIELAPTIFERLRAEKVVRALHRIAFWVVIIGISLSSLHHSSLGSLFLVTPQRLHPLWYSPWLPLLFIVSAMGAGLMVAVLVKMLWARLYDPASVFGSGAAEKVPPIQVGCNIKTAVFSRGPEGPEAPGIRALASIAAGILGVYLGLKIIDLFIHGGWAPLAAGTWESWLFVLELVLTAVLPVVLLIVRRLRRSAAAIGLAAFSAVFGLALNRLDVGIFGYFRDAAVVYFPSLIEWAVGLGVVAAAGLVLFFVVEHFPIFSEQLPVVRSRAGLLRLSYGSLRQLWNTVLTDSLHRVSLIAVFTIPLAFVLMYPPYYNSSVSASAVRPATGVDVERTILRVDGDGRGVAATFAHADHQKRLGDSASCRHCHHISLPHDRSTSCSRCHRYMNVPTVIFDHGSHVVSVARDEQLGGWYPANHSCTVCHPEQSPKTSVNAADCMKCHKDNMFLVGLPRNDPRLRLANSFREAMHRTCVSCHKESAVGTGKPHLDECLTCHESLRPRSMAGTAMAGLIDQE